MSEPSRPSFAGWMGSMWAYTLLRAAVFLALWGIMLLLGLGGLLALLAAAVLSVPLSFVLLSVPRARFAANLEGRIEARRTARARFDEDLDPGQDQR